MVKAIPFSILLAAAIPLPAQSQPFVADGPLHSPYSLENDAEHPCISTAEYALIARRSLANAQTLGIDKVRENRIGAAFTLFQWPLQAANGMDDCSYYRISAYVDHDASTGSISDYQCMSTTYDGHRGTDISTWPFNFHKMDHDMVEVVAAASGTILDKHDGEFDRNCSSNTMTANYVMIQHLDGSRALYWHMKNGSITSTAIGQNVVAGEKIGVVGSSGSSSGPHLHFEVWDGSTVADRIDPYYSVCNTLNSFSWWLAQKPHTDTRIVRASTHSTDIVLPGCPTTETLNESSSFTIPFQGPGLPAGYAKFYIFIREEQSGLSADLSILDSNGAPYLSWTYNSTSNASTKIFGWSKILPTVAGTYTFRSIYNGDTCSSNFDIVVPAGIASAYGLPSSIHPNPSDGKFRLDVESGDFLEVQDMLGKQVLAAPIRGKRSEFVLEQKPGLYSYQVFSEGKPISRGKLILAK